MKKILPVLSILGFFFLYHGVRDFLQWLGISFWLTEIGHQAGIRQVNFLLEPIHLSYQRWMEGPFSLFCFNSARLLFKAKEKIKQKLNLDFLQVQTPPRTLH